MPNEVDHWAYGGFVPLDPEPTYMAPSFRCPSCGAFAQQEWSKLYASSDPWTQSRGVGPTTPLAGAECQACSAWSVWEFGTDDDGSENGVLLWPTGRLGQPPPDDMPADVCGLYEEARAVAAISPRSSAALLRLALETLLIGRHPEASNLNDAIRLAGRSGLGAAVTQAMDVLRVNGNEAVHELRHDDSTATVSALFRLLELAVDQLVTQPRVTKEMFDQLPEGARRAIEQRDS